MIFVALLTLFAAAPDRTDAIWNEALDHLNLKLDQAYHDGRFEECVGLLRAMRGFDPKDEAIAANLVFMLRNVERGDEAFAEALRFAKDNPTNVTGANEVARFHFAAKKWQLVVDTLEPVVGFSDDPGTFTMLGRSYEELGKPKESLRVWLIRQKKQPEDPVANRNVERLKQKIGG